MAPTRSKTRGKASNKSAPEDSVSTTPKVTLGPQSSNPPKVFILPKDTSPLARIVTLAHPKTQIDTRYFVCPEKGFYEFTRIGAPKSTPRSWLLAPQQKDTSIDAPIAKPASEKSGKEPNRDQDLEKGYVTKSADLFIATPIDPLFFVLPVLLPATKSSSSSPKKRMFLQSDDYLDLLINSSPHFAHLLSKTSLRSIIETRMSSVCDTVLAGDETMYRISEPKLLGELISKAEKAVEGGLPPSMEEKLVRNPLDAPVQGVKRGEKELHELLAAEEAEAESSGFATPRTTSTDSQATIESQSSFSSTITAASSVNEQDLPPAKAGIPPVYKEIDAPPGVPELLRLRVAIDFISAAYLPSHLSTMLKARLASPASPHNFKPLDDTLEQIAGLREAATQVRSINDFSRKRNFEDEEGGESRAEKKKRVEEEEKKRKAGESRGVRDLKKVDVKGMKKMSDFFKKKS